jgi:Lon protease-like protein
MDEAVDTIELALFPLNTVLFPGQVMPLHIFEDRYRHMIRRCQAEDIPFGVVLIRHGQEVGEVAEPHPIGTVARIIESAHLPDGTMNIIAVGTERFRIRRLLRDQPYLRGEVEVFPMADVVDPTALARLTEHVRVQVARYIKLIAEAAGLQIKVGEIPEAAQQVGYLVAVALQVDNDEKQTLLGSASVIKILASETTLLNRENALLDWMARNKDWPERAQFGSSGSLLPN